MSSMFTLFGTIKQKTFFKPQSILQNRQTSLAEFPVLGTHPAQQVGFIDRDFVGDLHVCNGEFQSSDDG